MDEARLRLQVAGKRRGIRNILYKVHRRGFPLSTEKDRIAELKEHIAKLKSGENF